MQIKEKENCVVIDSLHYTMTLAVPPAPSYFFYKKSGRLFGFIAAGDCDPAGGSDGTLSSGKWQYHVSEDGSVQLRREETSSVWEHKAFLIHARHDGVEFQHELSGKGVLNEVRFFRACFDGREYGFAGDIDEVYSAAPNFREQHYYHTSSRVCISYGNDLSVATGAHALASVPHVMALHDRRDRAYLAAGVFAPQGEYLWDDFLWNPDAKLPPTDYAGDALLGGGFAVSYAGKKTVDGTWLSPRLVFTFPDREDEILKCALEYAYRKNDLPRPVKREQPAWWRTPIYCPWHDQSALFMKDEADYHKAHCSAGEFCTEEWTERWLNLLISHDAKPGIVILDDQWQKRLISADPDTDKWPDLRGWIERCHERGIRVFLWYPAWHRQEIPADEAITRNGEIVCGDITLPKHEARVREMIRRYFSDAPDGLNADGIKIDGLLGLPVGSGLKNHADLWGLELQRCFLRVVYEEAKKTKASSCVSVYTANPYLDAYTDMVRLADMYTSRLTPRNAMLDRKAVYDATHPYAPLDTDGQLNFHQTEDYIDTLVLEAELGVPTLYNAEFVRRHRLFFQPAYHPFTENDYREISRIFRDCRNELAADSVEKRKHV